MAAQETGFKLSKSAIGDDKLGDWLVDGGSGITGDLKEVPGIGPVSIELLGKPTKGGAPDDVVQSTHQLIGKFLSFKTTDIDAQTHCDGFFFWLKEKGIRNHRDGITHAVAEMVNTLIPGMVDLAGLEE
jgi:hypothetical protein